MLLQEKFIFRDILGTIVVDLLQVIFGTFSWPGAVIERLRLVFLNVVTV